MKKLYGLVSIMSLLLILSACGSKAEFKQVNEDEAIKILDSKTSFLFYMDNHDSAEPYKTYMKSSAEKSKTTINYFIDSDKNATGRKTEGDYEKPEDFDKRIKGTGVETYYIHAIRNGEVKDKLRVDDYLEGELSEMLSGFIERNK
ncbi:lipoprotein [Sporosarcina sp. BP05]|uniref:LptM family lipoprotein n=1 Tax=Sporosarcina sp. BP05 TaxID=2758726 RepID=UPI0016472858|nr:hypothetical protein [Sporosarcina sp. BP05]